MPFKAVSDIYLLVNKYSLPENSVSTLCNHRKKCPPVIWRYLMKCLSLGSVLNLLVKTNLWRFFVGRSVINLDVALTVVTNACDLCLVTEGRTRKLVFEQIGNEIKNHQLLQNFLAYLKCEIIVWNENIKKCSCGCPIKSCSSK